MIARVKNIYSWFKSKIVKALFYKENGVVYVQERCLLQETTKERNIAGSRLLAVFDDCEGILVEGKQVSKWYKLKNGDIVQVVVRPNKLEVGDILGAVLAAVAVYFSGGTLLAAFAVGGASLAVTSLSRLLAPRPDSIGETDATNQRADIRGSQNTVSESVVPTLFGKHLQTPFYGQRPYRLIGDGSATNKYRQYFIGTSANISLEGESLGQTNITDFSDTFFEINRSFGGSSFIGFDNVKAVPREEQLSVDEASAVSDTYDDNDDDSFGNGDEFTAVDIVLEFKNVDILNWGQKMFEMDTRWETSNTLQTRTDTLTVDSGDLTLVSGTTYRYNYSGATEDTGVGNKINRLFDVFMVPTTDTRITSEEVTSLLGSTLIEYTYDCGTYSNTRVVNAPMNKYTGVPSQVVETSPDGLQEVDLIFSFPQGSYTQNSDGSRSARDIPVFIRFKEVGGSYEDIADANALYVRDIDGVKQSLGSSTTVVNGDKVTFQPPSDIKQADELFFRTIGMELDEGQYTFQVVSADLLEKTSSDIGYSVISEFNFYVSGDVLDEDILPDLTQIAVDAVAYKDLTGELKKYNYIATSQIPIWDGNDWNTVTESRNPAAVVRYLLTDSYANPRAESVDVIDNDSLVAFYEYCETNNYYADGVILEPTKIGAVISKVLDNCKASFSIIAGKYTFVIDEDKDPVDLFTQHNTWGFQWTPVVGRTVDAIRVKYVNDTDYSKDELTLYWYNDAVHTTPDTGTSDSDYEIVVENSEYITDETHLIDRYSYSLTNIQTKRNLFEFSVNLESLNLKLFDRIYVANTCDMENESSGLIKEVITDGGNITGFKLYTAVEIADNSVITIRSIDTGAESVSINTYDVTNGGYTDTVEIDHVVNSGIIKGKGTISGFTSGYTWDYDGDHFDLGVSTIYTCLVTEIRYNEDLTATITAREA